MRRTGPIEARHGWRHSPEPPWTAVLALAPLIMLGAAGCSVQKLAAQSMVPIVDHALSEAYASGDIATVREGMPGQILLLRGTCQSDLGNTELWTTLVQLYASYALTFVESEDPARAARLYTEGAELGLRFLKRRDWFTRAWDEGPDALRAEIARRHPQDLAPLLMWTSACLGKHILSNLDRPVIVADLPYAHVLADAAIVLAGDYFFGMPRVLKAVMLVATPPMLGGDPATADGLFQAAFRLTERRFLYHHVLYARHFCVATLDEARFDRILQEVLEAPENLLPEARLMNLIAKQEAHYLQGIKEDLF